MSAKPDWAAMDALTPNLRDTECCMTCEFSAYDPGDSRSHALLCKRIPDTQYAERWTWNVCDSFAPHEPEPDHEIPLTREELIARGIEPRQSQEDPQ